MRIPAKLAAILARIVAAVFAAYSTALVTGEAISYTLRYTGGSLPFYYLYNTDIVTMLLAAVTSIATILGRYRAAIIILGLLSVYAYALGAPLPLPIIFALLALLVAPVIERRFELLDRTGVRVERRTTGRTLYALIGYYTLILLAAYVAYMAGNAIGSIIAQLFAHAGEGTSLSVLASIAKQLIVLRVVAFVVIAWLLYRIMSHIAEPVFFGVFASREAVKQLVERMIREEHERIRRRETWYQKLYISAMSHLAGVIAFIVVYGVGRVVALILTLLAAGRSAVPPYISYLLDSPLLVGLIGYYAVYRVVKSRLAKMLYEAKPPSMKSAAVLMVLAAVVLLASGTFINYLLFYLKCALYGGCAQVPTEQGIAATIDAIIASMARIAAQSIQEAALLINYIASVLFG